MCVSTILNHTLDGAAQLTLAKRINKAGLIYGRPMLSVSYTLGYLFELRHAEPRRVSNTVHPAEEDGADGK
jgi:hypothetical protein